MFAGAKKVDNLISTVDFNGQQIDGTVKKVLDYGDIRIKFEAFGWKTLQMYGNDIQEVVTTLKLAKTLTGQGQPVAIVMKTHMGYPVDFMLDNHEWHGVAPNDEQLARALAQLPETIGDY